MITVTTVTQMNFKDKESYEKFIEKDFLLHMHPTFLQEIRTSEKLGIPVLVESPRPEYGCLTVSTVCYSEIKP